VDTTDGAVGVVNRVFAGRNLFGDNTCCGALATYKFGTTTKKDGYFLDKKFAFLLIKSN
jgi:hypothetical protein